MASFFGDDGADDLPRTTSHPFDSDDFGAAAADGDAAGGYGGYASFADGAVEDVDEEITVESDGVPIRHVSGGYSPSPFSPELEPNGSDGPILPPPTEMREEGILLREWRSIVETVGEGVTDLAPCDHVVPIFTRECKECAHCKLAESNMCDLLRLNTDRGVIICDCKSRFSINGKPIYHFFWTSTFSQYTVMHVGCVAKINPEAPLDKVCVLSCGISTGLGASFNVAKPAKSSNVAIFGLGAVGLPAAEGARIAGASRIISIALNANRFEDGIPLIELNRNFVVLVSISQ